MAAEMSRGRADRLPAEVTGFVGRRRELADVKALLAESRLVTLMGTGGVGKTRLATRVAAEVRRAFPDGVWLVELDALEGAEPLVPAVAEAVGLREPASGDPLDALAEHLRDRRALLVLDNCEHVLHECAVLAGTLLRAAPDLRVLATSRHALGLTGERTLTVPPLSLPEEDASGLSAAALTRFDAVRLFEERAAAVVPGFAVTAANRAAVAGVCRRLDGIPLAIELAAVRLRALSVEQLLDRLDDRFRLLTGGSRAVLPRHRTLRALIDWSYALCDERERLLWARVSVFAGGLDLEAAEAVCAGDGIGREDVLDLVTALVDKSVLIRQETEYGVRYRLLDTIRQYGRARLAESGQVAAMSRRHRGYYRDLAARACVELFGPGQVDRFARLQRERANLRAALEHCFGEPGEAATGLAMAADLLYHWITSRHVGEGRRWLARGLDACAEADDLRARALWAAGWLAVIQADVEAAEALLGESREIAEKLGLEIDLGYAALFSGMVAMIRGKPDAAIARYEEALARHRSAGEPAGIALALIRLCLAHSFLGDSRRAIACGEECLALCDAHGEAWHRAYTTMALGIEVWRQGDPARAAELAKESLRFDASLDDLLGVGVNLEVLAWIAAGRQRYDRAARLLGVLSGVWAAVGAPLSGYGHLARYHDECEAATREALGEAAFRDATRRGERLSYEAALAYALEERPPAAEPAERSATTSPLTRRETEIAHLVARGMSNKEIAASLVISQRTVEGHIEHIMSKLGFNSRAQIAAWVGAENVAPDRDDPDPRPGETPSGD